MNSRFACIGVGNLGAAIVKGILNNHLFEISNILLINRNEERLKKLEKELSCAVSKTISEKLKNYSLILLAIKPQDFEACAEEINLNLNKEATVVSVMAGITCAKLKKLLPNAKSYVRVMPNLPVHIGQGVSVIYADKDIEQTEIDNIEDIFNSVGISYVVNDEELIDVATSIIAGGPGFIFQILNDLKSVITNFGFDTETSNELVLNTLIGSLNYYVESEEDLDSLVGKVASKGGTTREGLNVIQDKKLKETFKEIFEASIKRAKELSK